jgi:hypothetical protein
VIKSFDADRNASVTVHVLPDDSPSGSPIDSLASNIGLDALGILDGMPDVGHDEISFDESLLEVHGRDISAIAEAVLYPPKRFLLGVRPSHPL